MNIYKFRCLTCGIVQEVTEKNFLAALDKLVSEHGWKAIIGAAICPDCQQQQGK